MGYRVVLVLYDRCNIYRYEAKIYVHIVAPLSPPFPATVLGAFSGGSAIICTLLYFG